MAGKKEATKKKVLNFLSIFIHKNFPPLHFTVELQDKLTLCYPQWKKFVSFPFYVKFLLLYLPLLHTHIMIHLMTKPLIFWGFKEFFPPSGHAHLFIHMSSHPCFLSSLFSSCSKQANVFFLLLLWLWACHR